MRRKGGTGKTIEQFSAQLAERGPLVMTGTTNQRRPRVTLRDVAQDVSLSVSAVPMALRTIRESGLRRKRACAKRLTDSDM